MKNILILLFLLLFFNVYAQSNGNYSGGIVEMSLLDESKEKIDGSSEVLSETGNKIRYNSTIDAYTFEIYDNEKNQTLILVYSYYSTNSNGIKIYKKLDSSDPTRMFFAIYNQLDKDGLLLVLSNNLVDVFGDYVYTMLLFKNFIKN